MSGPKRDIVASAVAMDATTFGTLAGLTIQQTPQVIAAGFALGPEAGEVATVTKLVRISMLAPVVLIAGLTYRLRFQKGERREALSLEPLTRMIRIGLPAKSDTNGQPLLKNCFSNTKCLAV